MTIVYGTQGDYALAKQWSMKARNHLLFETSDDFNKWTTYMQLGRMYDLEGNLDSAEYYGKLCLNIMTRAHHDGLEQETYVIMGHIARKRGQYDKALMYYRSHPALLMGIAQTYYALHLLDSARYYGLKAYNQAFSHNQPISIMESSKFMSQVYENTDPKKSIQYLKVYTAERDKYFNNEKLKNMEALELANSVVLSTWNKKKRRQKIELCSYPF
jgi:tetratricopeptide (TPR) repeat protein